MEWLLTFAHAREWLEWAGELDDKFEGEAFVRLLLEKMTICEGGVVFEDPGPWVRRPGS